jgi:hypothetical protein
MAPLPIVTDPGGSISTASAIGALSMTLWKPTTLSGCSAAWTGWMQASTLIAPMARLIQGECFQLPLMRHASLVLFCRRSRRLYASDIRYDVSEEYPFEAALSRLTREFELICLAMRTLRAHQAS